MLKQSFAAMVLLAALQGQPPADARQVVRDGLLAVEGDSAPALRARLERRLRAAPGDRAARLGLATLARLTYDDARATEAYRALDDGSADAYATYARLGLGEQHYARGEMTAADTQLARARELARRTSDAAAEASALSLLAMTRAPVEGVPAGLATLDSAERRLPPAAHDGRADLLRFRAVLLAVDASGDSAARVATACVDAARAAGVRRAEAQCRRAEALNLRLRGAEDSALALLAEVERLQRLAHDRAALAETLVRRSDALRGAGRLGASRRALRDALAEATASSNAFALGAAHTGLGAVALRLRDHGEAAEQLRAATRVYAAAGDSASLAGVRAFQSILAAAIGDLPAARRHAADAIAHYRRVGDAQEEISVRRQLAAVELRARDWPAVARVLDEADALARGTGNDEWRASLDFDRARLALHEGELAAAERGFLRYLAQLDSADHVLAYTTRAHLAELHARRGDLARAAAELAAAGDALDTWRAGLSDEDLRLLAFQAGGHDFDGRDPSGARVLAALAAGGRADDALALAERGRARTLMDRFAQDDALRAGAAPTTDAPARAALLLSPASRGGAAPTTAAALAAALPDAHTALLEFVAGRDAVPSTALLVTRAGVRAYSLPPADSLASAVARLATLLEAGDDPSVLARALGAAILDPAVAALDSTVTRLVIVPDGPLHRVPFDALRLADGRHVVERFAVSLAPSGGVAAALWSRPRAARGGPVRLLAVGDPTFAPESAAVLPRLPASGDEARAVARFTTGADVRLRGDASTALLRDTSLARYQVIHLATHALVDDRGIGRATLALAPTGGDGGLVGPGDLAALPLGADLVVLSACRTAGGVVLDGEGVQGVTAPLLQAGARSVVATSWRIEDRQAVRLVVDFYAALARGLPVSDALREAKLAAMRRGAPAGQWAAFTVVGDPLVTLALQAPTSTQESRRWVGRVAVIVGTLVGIVILVVAMRWRR
jgi:CHAT domain-containing protein